MKQKPWFGLPIASNHINAAKRTWWILNFYLVFSFNGKSKIWFGFLILRGSFWIFYCIKSKCKGLRQSNLFFVSLLPNVWENTQSWGIERTLECYCHFIDFKMRILLIYILSKNLECLWIGYKVSVNRIAATEAWIWTISALIRMVRSSLIKTNYLSCHLLLLPTPKMCLFQRHDNFAPDRKVAFLVSLWIAMNSHSSFSMLLFWIVIC